MQGGGGGSGVWQGITHMYIVTVTGFVLWTLYGVLLKSWPLVGSNLVSLALASLILVLKLRYPGQKAAEATGT